MATSTALEIKKVYTYDDYLKIDDGQRYELIDGKLVLTLSPGTLHQFVVGNIFKILDECARRSGAGKVLFAQVDVVLDEPAKHNVFQPDVILFLENGKALLKKAGSTAPRTSWWRFFLPELSGGTGERKAGSISKAGYGNTGL